jgi:ABC-type sugar transport system ATPase subunit
VLSIRNASRSGEFEDIHFDLHSGEVLGIAGLMGAGRTELVSALFGATGLDEGEVYLDGQQISIRDTERAVVHRLALITEDRKLTGLNLKGSVEDNLIMASGPLFCKWGVFSQRKANKKIDAIIKKLSIKIVSQKQGVKFLSGGNQQKIVLAKWILCEPEIYIFDEPTRGIDVGAKSEIYRLMRQLVQEGKAIIMVSSEMPEVLGMCDRVIVLHEGKLMGELKNEEITQERIMAYASGEHRV